MKKIINISLIRTIFIFTSILFFSFSYFSSSSFALTETLNISGDRLIKCGADDASICTTGSGGNDFYDNSDFTNTYENSITIDSCLDGSQVTPYSGSTLIDFYEFVQSMSREDLNTTNEGGKPDSYVRVGDYVKITTTFLCSIDGDYYSILYKNSTNTSTQWSVLTTGVCYSNDYSTYASQLININVTKQIDNLKGNHTIRSIISYSSLAAGDVCGYNSDSSYSDTDDLIIESVDKLDSDAPVISIITPSEGDRIEYEENQVIYINFSVTDQTGVDFVNLSLIYGNTSIPLNFTNISNNYYANITNLSSLGQYTILFFANDTIETNSSIGTINHVNNYTSIYFILKNDVNINIISPVFNYVYNYSNISLGFTINDINLPFSEVYFLLNNIRTNLTETNYVETINTTSDFINNSLSNISQSFILDANTTIIDIGMLIKKSGNNQSNSTIILTNDSSGPFGNVLALAVFNNVNNQSVSWKKITLNQSVDLISSKKYWITILNESGADFLLFAYNQTYANGELYSNSSWDIGVRIYDARRFNSTLNSIEGTNALTICENNSISNIVCGYTSYKVDLSPPYFSAISYSSPYVEFGSNQTITIDVYDQISAISNVFLMFNNTNFSMAKIASLTNGGRYRANLNLSIGVYIFSIFANDSYSWQNVTSFYNFSVNDTTSPSLVNISYFPNSSDAIDPNKSLTINFTLADYSSLNETFLQYRPNTSSTWVNATPTSSSSKSFTSNFTPSLETTYYYRIYSKDIYGNIFFSQNYSMNIFYERYWSYTPIVFDSAITEFGQTLNLYNIIINNTGDVDLPFNITKSSNVDYTMVFSNSSFNLPKNNSISIDVNITAPLSGDGEHSSTFIVSCLDACSVKNATLGKSIIVGINEPYFDLKIYKKVTDGEVLSDLYNLRFNDDTYTTPTELIARIKNIAVFAADNVSFWYEFPNSTDFIVNITNPSNLTANFSIGKKNFDDTRNINIKFLIDRNTKRGQLYNLSIYTNFTYNGTVRNFSYQIRLNITNAEEVYNPSLIIQSSSGSDSSQQTNTPTLGGGGGAKTSPTGLGAGILLTYNLTIFHDKIIELFRGSNKTIQVNITNNYKNKFFSNISLNIEGYYQNHLNYEPTFIENLNFNETKTFNLTFYAPVYLGYNVNNIRLKFNYLVVSNGFNVSTGELYSSESALKLIVNEVSRNESFACLEQSISIINNATNKSYNVDSLNRLFDEQKSAVFSLDFTKAKSLCDKIKSDYEDITSYDNRLNSLFEDINKSVLQGYSLNEVLRLANITKLKFINGEYALLDVSIKDLENAYLLQIKTEDADIYKSFRKFVVNNIKTIIISIIFIIILSYFIYKQIFKIYVKNKILDLESEKKEINERLKELQKNYFIHKLISSDYFNTHQEMNKERIAKITERLLNFHYQSLKFEKKTSNLDALESKKNKIKESIEEIQKQYYINSSLDKKSYEKLFSSYNQAFLLTKKEINLLNKKQKDISFLSRYYTKFMKLFVNAK